MLLSSFAHTTTARSDSFPGARWLLGLALASHLTVGCAKDPLSDELVGADGDSILLVAGDDSGSPSRSADAAAPDGGKQPAPDGSVRSGCAPAPSTMPSVTLSPGAGYTPPTNARTERCFLLGGFNRDVYATAMRLVPEQRALVTEAAFGVVARAEVARLQALDQADLQVLGYACDASPSMSGQTLHLFAAAPEGVSFAQGEGALIAADSGLVLRVVYDTRGPNAANMRSDETKLSLWTLAPGQLPARVVSPVLTAGTDCR